MPTSRLPASAPRAIPPMSMKCPIGAVLFDDRIDAFAAVDLGDAGQLGALQPPELDCRWHRPALAHGGCRGPALSCG
jgi:hypothetical protein